MTTEITKVCITGGPCAGKSTGISVLRQKLEQFGVRPLVVPEVATRFFTAGVDPKELAEDPEAWKALQVEVAREQIQQEKRFVNLAEIVPAERVVLLCDRGLMDGAAYCEPKVWSEVLDQIGLTTAQARQTRYDGVFHLTTAAKGALQHYDLENNPARTETPEQARKLDDQTLQAWTGHQRLQVIGNTRYNEQGESAQISFDEKLHQLLGGVCRLLELPVPQPVEKKFKLADFDPEQIPVPTTPLRLTQTYLTSTEPGQERRVRKIVSLDGGGTAYIYAEKEDVGQDPSRRVKRERVLGEREYREYLQQADPDHSIIHKDRYCFVYRNQYFQVDQFRDPSHPPILEADGSTEHPHLHLPDFLEIERDVSQDRSFRNAEIARRQNNPRSR